MIVDRSYRMSAAWIDEQINAYKRQTVQINANRVNVCLALAFVTYTLYVCTRSTCIRDSIPSINVTSQLICVRMGQIV